MRMATASTRRCNSAFNSLISACCSASVIDQVDTPPGVLRLSPILSPRAESGGQDRDQHGRKASDRQGMSQVDVPGPSFTPREKYDVHRGRSAPTSFEIPLAIAVALAGVASNFKELHMAGMLVVRSLEKLISETLRASRRETMPKRPRRDKQTPRPGGAPRTVGDLISARLPALVESAPEGARSSEWQVAVLSALGPALANKVNRCSLDSGRITVIAESSAWAARMRFALAEIDPALRELVPGYRELAVRVRPSRTRRR